MQGFSNCLELFQVIMANPVLMCHVIFGDLYDPIGVWCSRMESLITNTKKLLMEDILHHLLSLKPYRL